MDVEALLVVATHLVFASGLTPLDKKKLEVEKARIEEEEVLEPLEEELNELEELEASFADATLLMFASGLTPFDKKKLDAEKLGSRRRSWTSASRCASIGAPEDR